MIRKKIQKLILISFFILLPNYLTKSLAQISPDNNLPQASEVFSPDGQFMIINGGTERGNNLFHSFSTFIINNGQTAFFNNSPNITNIFSRVTGLTPSIIDGLITSNGSVNFFLMNPNGITFGPNAQIALGSFFATSADSITFADGQTFQATPDPNSLLSFARPIGVGLNNPGKIEIKGAGQPFEYTFFEVPILPIITPENLLNLTGLRAFPGAGITLVGGEIEVSQAALASLGGNLALVSIKEGFYHIDSPEMSNIARFADINISGSALGISGLGNQESILLWGKDINVRNGSLIFNQNLGTSSTGDITLKASNSININSQFTPTVIRNLTLGTGNSGGLNFTAPSIFIKDLVVIDTTTFNTGQGGNVQLEAEKLMISESISETIITGLGSFVTTQAEGAGGDIIVDVGELILEKGAGIVASTGGLGDAGDISISASNITIGELSKNFNTPALLSSVSFGLGNAGNVNIETQTLKLSQGGGISSTAASGGNAGNITINASRRVELSQSSSNSFFENFERSEFGTELNSFDFSNASTIGGINSLVSQPPPELQEIFNIESQPTGNSGSITITTPNLTLSNNGVLSVANFGTGRAGNISIKANNIILEDNSLISSSSLAEDGGDITVDTNNLYLDTNSRISTEVGITIPEFSSLLIPEASGGNINIRADKVNLNNALIATDSRSDSGGNINLNSEFLFSENSIISARSTGSGNGGNINFTVGKGIVLFGENEIIAEAVEGNGGNISITTPVFLPSATTRISASSSFGLDGNIDIQTPDNNLLSAIIPIKAQILEIDDSITQNCSPQNQNRFVIPGSETLPPTPENLPGRIIEYNPQEEELNTPIQPNAVIKTEDEQILLVNLCLKRNARTY
ncbi:hypothetical protein cce_4931 [Crocosphaera subtropica ATCC 51142]|uniref:Filamentous haemagglutinin FhaB/tRNA nuclease CdiA-like TPS domain-containing protein n=1 Tax=Crocosphaera subtropica (strain ATCC 51142 / BH68) TaxID=43989 RepID=B1X2B6_CROS5|nr:filamentous hemagglutinin N-terminal domain-containing protein [Crocosphaera subtropica]ACB54277.1 hypothetical protein cce_4931 [Crocosphaera subtropica ATCC 51142]